MGEIMQSEGKKKQTNVLQQADFFKNDTQHMIYEELLLSSMGWQSTGKTVKKKINHDCKACQRCRISVVHVRRMCARNYLRNAGFF